MGIILIVLFAVGAYLSMVVAMFIVLCKVCPDGGDERENKLLAVIWPLTSVIIIMALPWVGINALLDKIRESLEKEK